jgi:two-component system, cell cycle response regulator DivK
MSSLGTPTYSVLVVDDDVDSLEVHRTVLEWLGWEVDTATHGLEALSKAYRNKPDVILLDLVMPGMDGGVVLDRLRGDPRTKSIPVIAVTGVPEWFHDHQVRESEFEAVLRKPVPSDTLVQQLVAALTNSKSRHRH